MNTPRERLIHLHAILADNWQLLAHMYKLDNTFHQVYEMSVSNLKETFFLTTEKASYLYDHLQQASPTWDDMAIITLFDEAYPSLLKHIYDFPWALYAKGNTKLLQSDTLSIVGTRKPTKYGYHGLEHVMKELPTSYTIVSGLALGIDTYAHQLAIKYGHPTIAVIGSGFSHLYPKQNISLANEIATNHLLLSEYPPNFTPRKWYFPKRNRIISGLSLGTFIVEAKARSGSLITADCAMEQGREVFALPGLITEQNASGTNYLIQQGAKLITKATDIMEEFHGLE